jgi:preprotein translocase subunit SecB
MKAPPLLLVRSEIGEIVLRPNDAETFAEAVTVTAEPVFARNNEDPKQWLVTMRVAFAGAHDRPLQYEGHIDVVGTFRVTSDLPEEQHLKAVAVTCPSILYGTARELIATLTARSKHGAYFLPTVSFTDGGLEMPKPPGPPES